MAIIAFGQELQMTNILKDSPEDRVRGVSWKPADISQGHFRYCLSKATRLIKLYPAHKVKLSRSTVMTFYSFTKVAVKSDVLMKAFFFIFSGALRNVPKI